MGVGGGRMGEVAGLSPMLKAVSDVEPKGVVLIVGVSVV
jgi:hypothetical protein